jgi:chromosome partitioning protein
MARIIAVGNLKGGVGKSTLAVNLACQIAAGGKRVILVDADAQGTATEWGALAQLPITVQSRGIDTEAQAPAWMTVILGLDADLVVIDLPPHIGTATTAALMLADLFIVPTTPSLVDIRATQRALDLLAEARTERAENGKPACLLVPSKVDKRTAAGREIEAALHELGERVAPAVGQRSAFVDSAGAGSWVGAYAPRSAAHTEIQTLAAVVRRMTK